MQASHALSVFLQPNIYNTTFGIEVDTLVIVVPYFFTKYTAVLWQRIRAAVKEIIVYLYKIKIEKRPYVDLIRMSFSV